MKYDLVVIGAGQGGSSAAKEAVKLGLSVAIISGGPIGGTCLHNGCIPTKSLFEYSMRGINFEDSMAHAKLAVESLFKFSSKLKDFPFDFIEGFVSKIELGKIYVGDKIIECERMILATGSSPKLISGVDESKLLTNENIFDLTDLPSSLAIIGGGYVGCEFANIFSKFGSKVEVFELGDRLLLTEDEDVLRDVKKSLISQDVKINVNSEFIDSGFDKVLVAVGRTPNVDLVKDFFECSNGVKVDSSMKTESDFIYAIGDVLNLPFRLAHVSETEGIIAARNVAISLKKITKNELVDDFKEISMTYDAIPTKVFVDPVINSIGAKEFELKEMGINYSVGRAWAKSNGMSYCKGDLRGFVKVLVSPDTHLILGAVAVGNYDLHEIGICIKEKIRAERVLNLVHFHPGDQELIKVAVKLALKN